MAVFEKEIARVRGKVRKTKTAEREARSTRERSDMMHQLKEQIRKDLREKFREQFALFF